MSSAVDTILALRQCPKGQAKCVQNDQIGASFALAVSRSERVGERREREEANDNKERENKET